MFPFSYARLFLNLYTCFCYRVQMFSFWCTPSWKKVYTFSNLAVHLFEFWCTPFCSLSPLVRQNITARSAKHHRSFSKTSPFVQQNTTARPTIPFFSSFPCPHLFIHPFTIPRPTIPRFSSHHSPCSTLKLTHSRMRLLFAPVCAFFNAHIHACATTDCHLYIAKYPPPPPSIPLFAQKTPLFAPKS